MPPKRERPLSDHTDDAALIRRRALGAARVQRLRDRRRAERGVTTQPTQAQLQQGEQIISLSMTADEEAAVTLTQIGLRVSGLTLPQDTEDARLQQGATEVDEHRTLYSSDTLTAARNHHPSPSQLSPRTAPFQSNQSQLSQFFSSRPPSNPFSISAQHVTAPPPPIRLSPVRDTFSPLLSTRRSPSRPSFSPLSASILENIDVQRHGSEDLIFEDNDSTASTDNDDNCPEDQNISPQSSTAGVRYGRAINSRSDHGTVASVHGEENSFIGIGTDNGEEDSVYNFASERATQSGDEADEQPISDLQYTVDKLFAFFQGDVSGCTEDQHDERHRQHMADVPNDDHQGLNDIFNEPDSISVLASTDILTPAQLSRYIFPSPAQFQSVFCGISQHPRPQHVCLHREESREQPLRQSFDVDSYLGFLHSLAACREGLWHQPAPQARQNMTNDVHLETPMFVAGDDAEQAPRATLAMLRDVPHFLLGRVANTHDITIHILFPHLSRPQGQFIALTHEQLSRWLDRVFYPAVYYHCPAHVTQHLPASFRHAFSNSKARQVEGRKIETASYQAQQALGYHLQPEYLEPIWTDILRTIDTTPGLADFQEPQLFFSAKGSKLQFKTGPSRPTLLGAMEHFHSHLDAVFDRDFVDWERTFVDLGTEICPAASRLASDELQIDEEAQVLSWKRCCLEQIIRRLYDNQAPAKGGRGQRYYDQNMLYEAATVTSVPPKHSRLYRGGVPYFQLYGSVKEFWDAAKSQPFDNDGVEEMALDPQIRQAAHHLAGGHRREIRILERAYCASKRRAHQALRDSRNKSAGLRAEFRMTWTLFRALTERLRLEPREELEVTHVDCLPYAWTIKTDVYLSFLWRSADKFAGLFEIVRARCRQDLVTWEQTKMMAMALRCLRFVLGGHQLSRESALWWSRREREVGNPPRPRIWYGLGFCNTLARYGYCWLEPRIDWERLLFKPEVTDRVLFGNSMLRGQYLRRGGQVEDFFHTTRRLELALEWLDRHHRHDRVRDQLIFWMVHLCLQQFRVDVLGSIKSEIREEHREDAVRGNTPFCFEYFAEIMVDPVYLISGNRCDFKVPSHLGHFLFDFEDGRVRTHWDSRPFRTLYRRARTALSLLPRESGLGQILSRRFWRCLYAYHWVQPYPSPEVLTQTTKQGQRMMYSIELEDRAAGQVELVAPDQWTWARKSWRIGRPPRLPRYLPWNREEWEGWIERQIN